MNRNWVLFHLAEARDELDKTIAEIGATPDYDYGEFWVAMQHFYHHTNTAWNARDASPSEIENATDDDFNRWSRFPSDLPTMSV